jgi:hypothetical protein
MSLVFSATVINVRVCYCFDFVSTKYENIISDIRLLVLMHVDTRRLFVLMHVDTRQTTACTFAR